MIIDFHTHIFPDKIAARTLQVLSDNTERVSGARELPNTDGTLSGLKRSMAENNIDYSVVMPIATTVTQSNTINNFAAGINGHDNVFSFGSVHPMQENCMDELCRIKQLGLRGIKLHPEYQGVNVDSPECAAVVEKCMELGLLVMFHAGRDIGIEPPLHGEPERFRRLLDMTGADNIIAAHMGGWQLWDDVEKYLVGQKIYFDTSYSFAFMSDEQIMRIIRTHGADRILYGTDSPWEVQSVCCKKIAELPLTADEREKILCKNGASLIGLL